MKFDYNSLRTAANEGVRVGGWKSKSVFACSREDLENKGSGAYYIVYDDDNALVGRSSSGGLWKYGYVGVDGSVIELSQSECYNKPAPQPERADAAVAFTFGDQNEPTVDVDFRMNADVNEVLKQAREMTIDSLLEGFNYGLDVAEG